MKKRMLITTIVMLLVLAVALTTSSLAWFTASQATVTATGGQFTATTSNSVVALGISDTNYDFGPSMEFRAKSDMNPLCMTDELKSALDEKQHTTALEALNLNGVLVKTVNGIETFYVGNIDNSKLSDNKLSPVYVTNQEQGSVVKDVKVAAHVTAPDKANNLVMLITYSKVAGNDETSNIEGYFVLVVSSISGKTTYTVHTFSEDDNGTAITTASGWTENADTHINGDSGDGEYTLVGTVSGIDLQPTSNTAEDAVHTVRFDIYAWYDGVELKSTTSGAVTYVDFQFEGVSGNAA